MHLNSDYFRLKAIAETSDTFINKCHPSIKSTLLARRDVARKIIDELDAEKLEIGYKIINHHNAVISKFYSI